MWRLRNFLFKFKRGISWFVFSFKQEPWQEDYQFSQTIQKVLLDTADYFEKREKKGYVVGVDNKADIQDMRLAAKLIQYKVDGHYFDLVSTEKAERDFKILHAADKKDNRCFEIAMRIISERCFHWWV